MRERKEDIPLLINKFLEELISSTDPVPIEEETLAILMDYEYPGNVRELKSIIQSTWNLSQGKPLTPEYLPSYLRDRKPKKQVTPTDESGPIVSLAEVEKGHILNLYRQSNQNKAKTAKLLKIGLNTLRRKLEKYDI